MLFDTESHIWVASGKSTRGTSKEAGAGRGQLGRGKTISFAHLSELSTWENPHQLDDAFLHAVPRHWRTFVMMESTAKGRGNWWHKHWELSKDGVGRFAPIFIPWYGEPGKYSLPAPIDWSPNVVTQGHARLCEAAGPRWLKRTISLTRDQLYWYETERAVAEAKDNLGKFIEEVGAADDIECFQYAGKSIFGHALIERMKRESCPLAGMVEILPFRELRPVPAAPRGML
jgi:hypothetical protein